MMMIAILLVHSTYRMQEQGKMDTKNCVVGSPQTVKLEEVDGVGGGMW